MKLLAIQDAYSYYVTTDASHCKTEREEKILAANMMNYWWQEGGLENLPQGYEIVTEEARLKEIETEDCITAFTNGANHCQCDNPGCPVAN